MTDALDKLKAVVQRTSSGAAATGKYGAVKGRYDTMRFRFPDRITAEDKDAHTFRRMDVPILLTKLLSCRLYMATNHWNLKDPANFHLETLPSVTGPPDGVLVARRPPRLGAIWP